jgi:hypothetical protein
MKNLRNTYLVIVVLVANFLLLTPTKSTAQESTTSKPDYKNNPLWITMMNDPNANYFETVKAFREFFADRFLPEEPWDRAQEGGDPFEKEVGLEVEDGSGKKSENELKRESYKQDPNEPNYAEEVRAFKGWFYGTKPWVQSDGTIVNPAQQQEIIEKQQNELKETERKANEKK